MTRRLKDLPRPAIAPSILASDFARLAGEVARAEEAGADLLHVDVMDGHFVPNITIGPVVVEKLRQVTDLALDVHLMISEPVRYLQAFSDAGADVLTFHAEVVGDPAAVTDRIHELGCQAGVTVNPDVSADALRPTVETVDLVLVMSVFAGFGGQKFMPGVLPKMRTVRSWLRPEQRLEVDGGINPQTVKQAAGAGADLIVAGTSIFGAEGGDYAGAIKAIREGAAGAMRVTE